MRFFVGAILFLLVGYFVIPIPKSLVGIPKSPQREAFEAAYRRSPDATARELAMAYKRCAKSTLHDAKGAYEFRIAIAKMFLIDKFGPATGRSEDEQKASLDKEMRSSHDRLDEGSRREIIKYGDDLIAEGVVECVFSPLV